MDCSMAKKIYHLTFVSCVHRLYLCHFSCTLVVLYSEESRDVMDGRAKGDRGIDHLTSFPTASTSSRVGVSP